MVIMRRPAGAVEFDWQAAYGNIQAVRPGMQFFKLAAKTGDGWTTAI
jgi:hypothetical protein